MSHPNDTIIGHMMGCEKVRRAFSAEGTYLYYSADAAKALHVTIEHLREIAGPDSAEGAEGVELITEEGIHKVARVGRSAICRQITMLMAPAPPSELKSWAEELYNDVPD